MPVHDWTQVDAETFQAFHTAWILRLSEALNRGLMPLAYYALAEEHGSKLGADVLRLQGSARCPTARRTLSIRHITGHRLIAMIEIITPSQKARAADVQEFVDKAESALACGVHLLMVDLFPPGPHDPSGLHGALWRRLADEPSMLPTDQPLTLASYVADQQPQAYVDHLAVGAALKAMPLLLAADRPVNVPLEETYAAAFQGMPRFWREVFAK
jgi:hypothetical protein